MLKNQEKKTQKYRKIGKNVKKLGKNRQKCWNTLRKQSKMSKNHQK